MLLGAIIKRGLQLTSRVPKRHLTPIQQQRRELRKLLVKSSSTSFGKQYSFADRVSKRTFLKTFRDDVPLHTYNTMFEKWWNRCLNEETDVCWPGKVKYFALSSGTSESASKHIPVTHEMIKALRKASIRQILTLSKYNFPASFFEKGILWLGGSTDLMKQGGYYEGDVSGISARRVPIWFRKYYKPGKKISKQKDWNYKLEQIVTQAKDWDIGIISGVPSWVQILLEKIIAHYHLKNIHEIWPNLRVYVHGGVSFEPYKKSFSKFFEKPLTYIELYPASEGFIAFQDAPDAGCMKLILDNGIFYEFIPFDEEHFDDAGEAKQGIKTLLVNEVQANKDYALVMSTCAGAWRYILGDVIRFTSVENAEIVISGRTKHFLSLVGEHLSVDNMNKAIETLSQQINTEIPEFAVAGVQNENVFGHEWYLGCSSEKDDSSIAQLLDENLKKLNDDYEVERISALKNITVKKVQPDAFYAFMEQKGKMGGQNKFPRVLKAAQHEEWKNFLTQYYKDKK